MKYIKWDILINFAVGLLCLLLFFVPYYSAYLPGPGDYEDPKKWPDIYIQDSFEIFVFIPLIVIWLICLFIKQEPKLRRILKFILLGISALFALISLLYLASPIQDLIPQYGTLIPILICIMLLMELIYEYNRKAEILYKCPNLNPL